MLPAAFSYIYLIVDRDCYRFCIWLESSAASSGNREPAKFEFTPAEIEILAEMEHNRWVSERLFDGWVYGKKRDIEKKISPYSSPPERSRI